MRVFLAFSIALTLLISCNYKSQKADTVFHNAYIIDCDGIGKEMAELGAIAVLDGKIVGIGQSRR